MPPTARSAPRGERRGLLVLTAGPVGAPETKQPAVSSPPDATRGSRPDLRREGRPAVAAGFRGKSESAQGRKERGSCFKCLERSSSSTVSLELVGECDLAQRDDLRAAIGGVLADRPEC